MIRFACLLFVVLFLEQSTAFSIPTPKPVSFETWNSRNSMPASFAAAYDFSGIVALSNCSGSLVKLPNSLPTDKALILTNGHCLGGMRMLNPGEVVTNRPASRWVALLGANAMPVGARLTTTKIIYAAMTKSDIAVYELNKTFAEIKSEYRMDPLVLSATKPMDGTEIQVLSGYWRRGYSCSIEKTVFSVEEGGYSFSQSLRYSRPGCDVIGGTSGSPVIQTGTRTVIAVNNSISESGERCTINNPCEIDAQGEVIHQKGMGYAQQISWFVGCMNANRQLDLALSGCELAKPNSR